MQMGEVGEVCEILQWKGEVKPGVPELTEEEKVHLGEELSDVLIYLIRLSGTRCEHNDRQIAAELICPRPLFGKWSSTSKSTLPRR